MTLHEAISNFGAEAKSKLTNPSASGAPEDQLRTPLEGLIGRLAELAGLPAGTVVPVGETSLADLKTRPDYAVTCRNALIGFMAYPSDPGLTTCWVWACQGRHVHAMFRHGQPLET